MWATKAEYTVSVKKVTCESCCENEDRPIPAKHHGLWQLFPLPGGVSCELGEDSGESGTVISVIDSLVFQNYSFVRDLFKVTFQEVRSGAQAVLHHQLEEIQSAC